MLLPPSVLIYGRDTRLLKTRTWVLEQAGFKVFTTSNPEEATERIEVSLFDLFILCHTLSVTECTDILASAHALRPEMKMLILSNSRSACESKDDPILRVFASPVALLTAVRGLTLAAPV